MATSNFKFLELATHPYQLKLLILSHPLQLHRCELHQSLLACSILCCEAVGSRAGECIHLLLLGREHDSRDGRESKKGGGEEVLHDFCVIVMEMVRAGIIEEKKGGAIAKQ